jgi:hypothetical protein
MSAYSLKPNTLMGKINELDIPITEPRRLSILCATKHSVLIFVEKIYKMQHLEGSGTPVLYTGRRVLKA